MRNRRYIALLGCLGALSVAPPRVDAGPLIAVPLTQVAGDRDAAFLVDVRVGPLRNLHFLVDTAATRSAITPAVRNALGLKSIEAASEVVTGAGGNITAQRFILPALAVGDAVQYDLRVLVLDLGSEDNWMSTKLDGILGLDFLRNYDVRFNASAGTLELSSLSGRPALPPDVQKYARIPFRLASVGFMIVPILVNDRLLVGVLDTGASRSVLNKRGAASAGISPAEGEAIVTTGADRTQVRITQHAAQKMEIGRIPYRDETVSVGDLIVFEQYGLESLPSAIIGGNMLKDRDVYIFYSTNEVFLSRERTPRNEGARRDAAPESIRTSD
ncbi:MAG TPA: aspartyl protease family protein [Armatimonadota bacterium]|jgi:clan AA aspartic protease (TIGR02281 family)